MQCASVLAQNLVISFAAAGNYELYSGDIQSAYLQGTEITRLLLLKQPAGGIPGVDGSKYMQARVPVYGCKDAGRNFWLALRDSMVKIGMRESGIEAALCVLERGGEIHGLACTHVDDVLWCGDDLMQKTMKELQDIYGFGKVEANNMRYCGRTITRDDKGIYVHCEDTLLRVKSISLSTSRKRQLMDPISEDERTQLRSLTGSLSWIVRQCRPDFSFDVSKLQTLQARAKVKDLLFANKVLRRMQASASQGLVYSSNGLDWGNALLAVATDASHAQEQQMVNGELEDYRSQAGRLVMLVSPEFENGDEATIHMLEWSSTVLKRVCRSTLQAEAYSLTQGVESLDHIRATLSDLHKPLSRAWEDQAAAAIRAIWVTDCKSLETALQKPVLAKVSDKRLGIELAALRQSLWRRMSEAGIVENGDPHAQEQLPAASRATDRLLWCDTTVMVSDCLTKSMPADNMIHVMSTGRYSIRQPNDAVLAKIRRSEQRRGIRAAAAAAKGLVPVSPSVPVQGAEAAKE